MKFDDIINTLLPEFSHSNIFYAESQVNFKHANWNKLMDRLVEARDEEKRKFIIAGEDTEYYTSKEQEEILDWCHPKNN